MSSTLFKRWFREVWNERRDPTIDELFAADGIAHGLPDAKRGPPGFRQFHRAFLELFPTLTIEVEDTIESAPDSQGVITVAGRFTAYVTSRSGKVGKLACMAFSRWKGGKITEAWNVCDFHGLKQQVGELPF